MTWWMWVYGIVLGASLLLLVLCLVAGYLVHLDKISDSESDTKPDTKPNTRPKSLTAELTQGYTDAYEAASYHEQGNSTAHMKDRSVMSFREWRRRAPEREKEQAARWEKEKHLWEHFKDEGWLLIGSERWNRKQGPKE